MYDVIVIGAGAAGLLAAARAAERGRRTLLLEKNPRPGVKILMSGGTRCNLTQNTDARGIVAAFGTPGRFLHSALAAFGPRDLVALVEAEGVPTKVEPTGKIFPASDRAADVLDALLRRLRKSGCALAAGEPLLDLAPSDGGFRLSTPKRTLTAARVVVTPGGASYPRCGTSGDGYRWAERLGHAIVPPRPSLTPLTTDAPWIRALKGVTIPDVAVRVVSAWEGPFGPESRALKRAPTAAARGGFLFTHFGLSGPAALDVSRAVSGHPSPRTLVLECDFLPDATREALDARLRGLAAAAGAKTLAGLSLDPIPARLREALLAQAGLDPGARAAGLSRAARRRWIESLKRQRIPLTGTLGFEKAEVTAGGIALDEVDSRTMESRMTPGLYWAGEILDLDGPIGGYNFQAAFSTGWAAGGNA
jgi:predicted Rossmann fold flavoprotein